MRPLRVVVLDNNVTQAEAVRKILPRLFAPLGYEVNDFLATTANQAEQKILEGYCDVVFSDLVFGTTSYALGLDYIKQIKEKFPDVLVIACSGASPSPPIASMMQQAPHIFDFYVPKSPLLAESSEVWGQFQQAFRSRFQIATNLRVVIPNAVRKTLVDHPDRTAILDDRDISALVRQCLWSGPNPDSLFLPNRAELEKLGGGRSGSLVVTAKLSVDGEKLEFIPVVLKISPIERARAEHANFQRYVKLILPYPWRIDVIGYGETRHWGAIAYSYAFGLQSAYESLTEVLQRGDGKTYTAVVNDIFATGKIWYDNKYRDATPLLWQFYFAKYFAPEYRRQACERGFSAYMTRLGVNPTANEMVIDGTSYPSPERALFRRFQRPGTTTICHGDLNGNNVVVTKKDRAITFIDFQDTGRGHVFEDFVALESSARLYFKTAATAKLSLSEIIKAELKLNRTSLTTAPAVSKSLLPYANLVLPIRFKAKKAFPTVDKVEYFYALAAFHYRLMRLRDLENSQMTRAAGCMFAALQMLDELKALDP
jgi:CheY-like chemotaxis protein